MILMNGCFTFSNKVTAYADKRMNNSAVKNLWKSFCFTECELSVCEGKNLCFTLGDTALPELCADKEFAVRADEKGASVVGRDYGSLMRGFFSLLMKIEEENGIFFIRPFESESNYIIKNRMIHICVFPENDLYFIKKLVRLAGLCQYTHIVIEFWGMLRYDCLKELSWPFAFSKEQAREIIREAREFGMEPIPMFNQLGHATASRVIYGKHVVLDQNPKLRRLFTPDGWAWNIKSEEVRTLLKNVRRELYEVFGEGEYMHIGCDEAYFYTGCDEARKSLPDFLKNLTDDVVKEGRRPMLWMDMLLERSIYPNCYTTCAPEDTEKMIGALNPKTTLKHLNTTGFDVVGAPRHRKENYTAHVNTISQNNMFGIMITTWHTLKEHMPSILGCAKKCGASTFTWSEFSGLREETATLLRRVSFEGNGYADAGWSKEQIEI